MTAPAHKFRLQLRLKVGKGILMGPGRADLLALIRETGSIAAAGRAMGMSYKRAWVLVESMNAAFTSPLVVAAKGGAGGGGAHLTDLGETLLTAFHALEAALTTTGAAQLSLFDDALAIPPEPEPD